MPEPSEQELKDLQERLGFKRSVLKNIKVSPEEMQQSEPILSGMTKKVFGDDSAEANQAMADKARSAGLTRMSVVYDERARQRRASTSVAEEQYKKDQQHTGIGGVALDTLEGLRQFASGASVGFSDRLSEGIAGVIEGATGDESFGRGFSRGVRNMRAGGQQLTEGANAEGNIRGKVLSGLGHIGGLVVPAGAIGKLGTALRGGEKAGRLTKALGVVMGGAKTAKSAQEAAGLYAGAHGFLARSALSANNFGIASYLQETAKGTSDLTSALANGEITKEKWLEQMALNHSHAVDAGMAGYVTGGVTPAFAGFAGKLQNAILRGGGSEFTAELANKTLLEMGKGQGAGAVGRILTSRAIPGAVEFTPFHMLNNLTDESGNFTAGMHTITGIFSDDPKERSKAVDEWVVSWITGAMMKNLHLRGPVKAEGVPMSKKQLVAEREGALRNLEKMVEADAESKKAAGDLAERAGDQPVQLPPHVLRAIREVAREIQVEIPEDLVTAEIIKLLEHADIMAAARGDTTWKPVRERITEQITKERDRPDVEEYDKLVDRQEGLSLRLEQALRDGDTKLVWDLRTELDKLSKDVEGHANEKGEGFIANVEREAREYDKDASDVAEASDMLDSMMAQLESGVPHEQLMRDMRALHSRNPALREVMGDWDTIQDTFQYNPDLILSQSRRAMDVTKRNLQVTGEALRNRMALADKVRTEIGAKSESETGEFEKEALDLFESEPESPGVKKGRKVLGENQSDDPAGDLRAAAELRDKQGKFQNGDAYRKAANIVEAHPNIRQLAEKEGFKGLLRIPGIGQKSAEIIMESFGLKDKVKVKPEGRQKGGPKATGKKVRVAEDGTVTVGEPAPAAEPRPLPGGKLVKGGRRRAITKAAKKKAAKKAAAEPGVRKARGVRATKEAAPGAAAALAAAKEGDGTFRAPVPDKPTRAPVTKAGKKKGKGKKAKLKKENAELKQENRRLQTEALTDEMTGLGNRKASEVAIKRADADPEQAVAMIDGDNFGLVNKQISFTSGDLLIKKIGKELRSLAQMVGLSERNIMRRGGDEFVIVGPKDKVAEIVRLINETQTVYRKLKDGVNVTLTAGLGDTFALADAQQRATKEAKKAAVKPKAKTKPKVTGKDKPTLADTPPDVPAAEPTPVVDGAAAATAEAPPAQTRGGKEGASPETTSSPGKPSTGKGKKGKKVVEKAAKPEKPKRVTKAALIAEAEVLMALGGSKVTKTTLKKMTKSDLLEFLEGLREQRKEFDAENTKETAEAIAEVQAAASGAVVAAQTATAAVQRARTEKSKEARTREQRLALVREGLLRSAVSDLERKNPTDLEASDILRREAKAAQEQSRILNQQAAMQTDKKLKAELDALSKEASRVANARYQEAEAHRRAVQSRRAFNEKDHNIEAGLTPEENRTEDQDSFLRFAEKAQADFDKVEAVRKKAGLKVEDLTPQQRHKRELIRSLADQANVLAEMAKLTPPRRSRFSVTAPGSKPLPEVGTITTFETPDGPVTGLVVRVGKKAEGPEFVRQGGIPGRRITIADPDTLVTTSIRIGDIIDLKPASTGDIVVYGPESLKQITDAGYGAEISADAFASLIHVASGVQTEQMEVRLDKGMGGKDRSAAYRQRLLQNVLDKPWEVNELVGTEMVESGQFDRNGEPIMRRSPIFELKKGGTALEAARGEALSRHHRLSHGAGVAEDYLLEAIARLLPQNIVHRGDFELRMNRSEKKKVDRGEKMAREKAKKTERYETDFIPDTDDITDAWMESQGQMRYYDPAEAKFDWFNRTQRVKAETKLKDAFDKAREPVRAENGSKRERRMDELSDAEHDAVRRWGEYLTLKAEYEQKMADVEARRSAVDATKKRKVGFTLVYPRNPGELTKDGETLVSIRSRTPKGELNNHSYWVAKRTPEGTIFIRPLGSYKDRQDWLTKHGVDVQNDKELLAFARDAEEYSRMTHSNDRRQFMEDVTNEWVSDLSMDSSIKQTAWGRRGKELFQEGMDAIAPALWDGDFSKMKEAGFSKADIKEVRDWVKRFPNDGSEDWMDRMENFLHRTDASGRRQSANVVRPYTAEADKEVRLGKYDPDAGLLAEDVMRENEPVQETYRTGEKNGLLIRMVRRAQNQFNPITGFPVKETKGQWIEKGGPRDGIVLMEGSMLIPYVAARAAFKTAGSIARFGEGIIDSTMDAIYSVGVDPVVDIVMNHDRLADLIPAAERYRATLEKTGSAMRRFLTSDDPTGGIRTFMNEAVGGRKWVDQEIHRIIDPIRRKFTPEELLKVDEATGEVSGLLAELTRGNRPAELGEFISMVDNLGERLVKAKLLKAEQVAKWKGRYLHFGRYKYSAEDVAKRILEVKKSWKEANQELRAMVKQGKSKAEIASKQKEVNGWDAMRMDLEKGKRGFFGTKAQIMRHPLDAIGMDAVSSFRNRGFGKKKTSETIEDAVKAGLDTADPVRLMFDTLQHEWHAVEQAEWFKRVATDGNFVRESELAPDHWVTVSSLDKVIDSTWEGFVGKKVHPQLYDWLKANEPTKNTIIRKWRYAESGVKLAATLGNLGNWGQQLMGNPLLMAAGGVPMTRMLQRYGEGFVEIIRGTDRDFYLNKNWVDQVTDADREFDRWMKEQNLDLETMPVDSVISSVYDAIRGQLTGEQWSTVMGHLNRTKAGAKRLGSKKVFSGMKAEVRDAVHILSHLYRSLDAAARIGMYKDLIEQGKSDAEATIAVNDIFDLQHVSKFAQYARRTPFLFMADSFVSVKSAMARNHKKITGAGVKGYAAYMAMSAMWNSIAASMEGRTDEEVQADIEDSIPANNPFTHWLDSRTAFWVPGRGAIDMQRWHPTGPLNDYLPGQEQFVSGIAGKMMGMKGPLRDRYGQTMGQGILGRALGSGSITMGLPAQVIMDRDERGRPGIARRYEDPGLLGTTGVLRASLETGALAAAGLGGLFSKAPFLSTALPATILQQMERLRRSNEVLLPWITDREIERQALLTTFPSGTTRTPQQEDEIDYVARLFGGRFLRPNALARERERLQYAEGTEEGTYGDVSSRETRRKPNTEEGLTARASMRRIHNINTEWNAMQLAGMVKRYKDYAAAGDASAAEVTWEKILRKWPDAKAIGGAIRTLGRLNLEAMRDEVVALVQAKGFEENFDAAQPATVKILK